MFLSRNPHITSDGRVLKPKGVHGMPLYAICVDAGWFNSRERAAIRDP